MLARPAGDPGAHELSFEAFGVRVGVVAPGPEELERLLVALPPSWRPCSPVGLAATFTLSAPARGYELRRDATPLTGGVGLEVTLELLEREIRALVALEAPDHIFVHAGAVAQGGGTIVIPGASLAGKTTLVAALVRAGAVYYSDEFAPLDRRGFVHPFAKPLSLRNERQVQIDHDVEALGGIAGEEPLPLGLVVMTTYRQGAEWSPRRLSPGEAALALLANTVPAQARPAQALRAINRSIAGTAVIETGRDDADAVAPLVLAELERALSERP